MVREAPTSCLKYNICGRGGVEDTRIEAKDSPSEDTLSRPRTKGHRRKCFPKKMVLKKFFRRSPKEQNKKGLCKFSARFLAFSNKILTVQKNSAVLGPRTGQFSRTWGFEAKAKDFKMCPRGQGRPRGLHLWSVGQEGWSQRQYNLIRLP